MNDQTTAVKEVQHTAEEKDFMAKYPNCQIVPGTLQFSTNPKYAGKRTALLVDVHNGEHVERATSDFHTWTGYGPNTIKIYRKAQKTKAKVDLDKITVEIEAEEGAPAETGAAS